MSTLFTGRRRNTPSNKLHMNPIIMQMLMLILYEATSQPSFRVQLLENLPRVLQSSRLPMTLLQIWLGPAMRLTTTVGPTTCWRQ